MPATKGETLPATAVGQSPVVDVAVRRFPYPFAAMLAICSDLDETPDRRVYYESTRFLNTTAATSMGAGVGLEVGNTIYFDMAPGQFAYWNTDDRGREMVRALVRSGHIDCLHSFGDLATTRAHAARALDELTAHDCQLHVWIDHAVAPTNFGADIMRGSGDVPGTRAYHADLTIAHGIRYVWRGRVTSVIGQGLRRSLAGLFSAAHPLSSAMTITKEFAKGAIAARGNQKYAPHAHNALTFDATLRDGRPVTEFVRSNPHFAGPSGGDTAVGIAEVLTDRFLDRLASRGGFCILYTHLGKVANPAEPFGEPARAAFRRLAARADRRTLLVTTTRRLLGYEGLVRTARVSTRSVDGAITVNVEVPQVDALNLQGLTIYVSDPDRTILFLNGVDMTSRMARNPADATGRRSISLPWQRLAFPSGL